MAGILVFHMDDVRRVVQHAKTSPRHMTPNGESDEATPVVLLVHHLQRGVFLMSSGLPADSPDGPDRHFSAYAQGCNPAVDVEWLQEARFQLGPDPFVESLGLDPFDMVIAVNPKRLMLVISDSDIEFIADNQ